MLIDEAMAAVDTVVREIIAGNWERRNYNGVPNEHNVREIVRMQIVHCLVGKVSKQDEADLDSMKEGSGYVFFSYARL